MAILNFVDKYYQYCKVYLVVIEMSIIPLVHENQACQGQ